MDPRSSGLPTEYVSPIPKEFLSFSRSDSSLSSKRDSSQWSSAPATSLGGLGTGVDDESTLDDEVLHAFGKLRKGRRRGHGVPRVEADVILSSKLLEQNLQVRICGLQGSPWNTTVSGKSELVRRYFVTAYVMYGDRFPICAEQRPGPDGWIRFPVKIAALDHIKSCVVFSVWSEDIVNITSGDVPIGCGRFYIWEGIHNTLLTGKGLHVPLNVAAPADRETMYIMQKYLLGQVPEVEWLDRWFLPAIERRSAAHLNGVERHVVIDVREFPVPVVFHKTQLATRKDVARDRFHDPECGAPPRPVPARLSLLPSKRPENVEEQRRLRYLLHRPVLLSGSAPVQQVATPTATAKAHLLHTWTERDKELVWRCRDHLLEMDTRRRRSLRLILQCVEDWGRSSHEVDRLVSYASAVGFSSMPGGKRKVDGVDVDVDLAVALTFLGPGFKNAKVKAFAVSILKAADDKLLSVILLQLIHALRYDIDNILWDFLMGRASSGVQARLRTDLYWYIVVEAESGVAQYKRLLKELPFNATKDTTLKAENALYKKLLYVKDMILKNKSGSRTSKIEKLRRILDGHDQIVTPTNEPVESLRDAVVPLYPGEIVGAWRSQEATIFKSNLLPMGLVFSPSIEPKTIRRVIFKVGDDLRQDQLVMAMLTLMDRVLQQHGMDLNLSPYRVLATGVAAGFMEWVPDAVNLSQVLAERGGSIQKYLMQHQGGDSDSQVDPAVLDRFIRSCAGYSVMTYILGVGDRHLDNILLCNDGRIFHIDFSYLFGRDPKPFPPPMRLSKDIVEGMGGLQSKGFHRFKTLCCEAYNILRHSADLIVQLLVLMQEANIPDLKRTSGRSAVERVYEKFRLDLSNEAAVEHMQGVIHESVKAVFPAVAETIHRIAQYFKS